MIPEEQKKIAVNQMREVLAESARLAVEALSAVTPIDKPVPPLEESGTILGEAINKLRNLVCPEKETVGEYRTPKAALDAVMANPPFNIPPAAEPVDPKAPEMLPGEKPFTTASLASIPELNIKFHEYHAKDYYKFLCWWHNDQEPDGRVYELTVKPWCTGAATDGAPKFRALAQTGGTVLFALESSSKRLAIECALVAMRRYLIRGHRAAWRTYRKARAAAKAEEA